MNEASKWRLGVGRKIAPCYTVNPKVKAVFVAGSVSRGWCDKYSDLEIGVFWDESPSLDERKAAIERAGGVLFWSDVSEDLRGPGREDFYVGGDSETGFKIELYHMSVALTERLLSDVKWRFSMPFYDDIFQHAIPLSGESLIERWQALVSEFPAEQVQSTVRKILPLFDSWKLWEMLALDDEAPELYQRFAKAEDLILRVVSLINHIPYDLESKWFAQKIQEMRIKPPDFSSRLREIFRTDVLAAVNQLRGLVLETFDFVDAHLPEVHTMAAREAFEQPPTWVQSAQERTQNASQVPQVLQRLAQVYSDNPKVLAGMRGGDASGRRTDQYSNIEIRVFWEKPPSESDQKGAIEQANGTRRRLYPYNPETEVWSETYDVSDVQNIEVIHYTVETVERVLADVRDRYDDSEYKQDLLAAIVEGVGVSGGSLIRQWKTLAATYPDELARKLVQIRLSSLRWDNQWLEKLAYRNDWLIRYADFGERTWSILNVLLGLNRIYHPASRGKLFWFINASFIQLRLQTLIKKMRIAPPNLASRLKQIYQMDPLAAVNQLREIREETVALVEAYMPEVVTTKIREQLRRVPFKTWEQPPEGLLE
ncbi:hypothetical protein HYR99_27740 [Candidatus Poribacteria bacterium]|nr:hypothetical protein [Candidatus Poribacteria bacterium]